MEEQEYAVLVYQILTLGTAVLNNISWEKRVSESIQNTYRLSNIEAKEFYAKLLQHLRRSTNLNADQSKVLLYATKICNKKLNRETGFFSKDNYSNLKWLIGILVTVVLAIIGWHIAMAIKNTKQTL